MAGGKGWPRGLAARVGGRGWPRGFTCVESFSHDQKKVLLSL